MKQHLVLKIALLAVLCLVWQIKANAIRQKFANKSPILAEFSSQTFQNWLHSSDSADCGCDGGNIPTPTVQPTPPPVIPTIPPTSQNSSDGGSNGEQNCTCNDNQTTCTADNTPNWKYNQTMDCNWVYNNESCSMECIHQNCTWQFDSANCSWYCEPNQPPSGSNSSNENCTVSCDDFKVLQDQVASIQESLFVFNQTSILELAQKISDLSDAVASILATQSSIGAAVDDVNSRLTVLEGRNFVAEVSDSIRTNGQYFGNRWWVGEQFDQLWAIDILSPSFYRFQSGVNATLG